MTNPPRSTLCFEALVREHQAGLRAYIRALGADDAWVDDLAQEAFLIAYRRLDDFEDSPSFGRWLRGIARNLVLNDRRKAARRSRLLHDPVVDALAENGDDTWCEAGAAVQLLQILNDCVARLPPRSRELLEKRYSGNGDAKALALAFESSAAAVRQTLMRSRAAVRRCMRAKLGEVSP